MPRDFAPVFAALKLVLEKHAKRLSVKSDQPGEYTLVTRCPSPFPQHKGQPMWVASVGVGKAYVSFHLMHIYMVPELTSGMSLELKKRMQGKTCFNFKTVPEPQLIAELRELTKAALQYCREKQWL
jgi:hypothetical protein